MVCVQGGHGVDPHLQLLLAPRRVHVTAVEGGTNNPLHGGTFAWTVNVVDGDLPPTITFDPDWLIPGGDVILPKFEAVENFAATADPTTGLIPPTAAGPDTPKSAAGETPRQPTGLIKSHLAKAIWVPAALASALLQANAGGHNNRATHSVAAPAAACKRFGPASSNSAAVEVAPLGHG